MDLGTETASSLHKGQLIFLGKEEKWLIECVFMGRVYIPVPAPIPVNVLEKLRGKRGDLQEKVWCWHRTYIPVEDGETSLLIRDVL